MSSDRDDAEGRQETTPIAPQTGEDPGQWQQPQGRSPYDRPAYGHPRYDQPAYDQPAHNQAHYGQVPYGQSQYGQPPYGQTPPGQPQYGQPPYGQTPHGQPPYGQAPYGSAPYEQYPPAQYGRPPYAPPQPARPGTVITAAVLGLVHGALGLLVTVALLAGGALIDDLASFAATDPAMDAELTTADVAGARIGLVVAAILALAWTVAMVWGSVLAIRGRSRVLLLVGASIAVATTALVLVFGLVGAAGSPGRSGEVGGVLFLLVFFLLALAMLVLLCLRSAGQFFAAHRHRRSFAAR